MSLPTRYPAPVSILYTNTDEPMLVRGRVVRAQGDLLDVELPEGAPQSTPGDSLILDFPTDLGGARAIVAVTEQDGARMQVSVLRLPKADLRVWPRVMGGIDLAYAVAPNDEAAVRDWLAGTTSTPLRSPDPYMSFSTGGLAFDDHETCKEDDLLLVEFGVPKEATRYRCTARVVRVSRIPIDERDDAVDATHRIAVNFEEIANAARLALTAHTARVQEAFGL